MPVPRSNIFTAHIQVHNVLSFLPPSKACCCCHPTVPSSSILFFFKHPCLRTNSTLHCPPVPTMHYKCVCYPFTTPQSPPVSCLRVSTLFLIYSTQPCPLLHWSISFLHWPAAGLLILQQLVRFHLEVSENFKQIFKMSWKERGHFLF